MKPIYESNLPAKFWDKVQVSKSGCWMWTGQLTDKGYGRSQFKDCKGRAHRLTAIDSKGVIPDGMMVLHKCDTPSCVRPSHLYYGTALDNKRDSIYRTKKWVHGSKHPLAKLDDSQVVQIRELDKEGTVKRADIARMFDVSPRTVRGILTRESWKHI